MSLEAYTYEEIQEKNSFISKDIERINTKASNLKELLTEYIKDKKSQYEDIQDFLHCFNNVLTYNKDDIQELLNIEKELDRIAIEIKGKNLIDRIRNLLDSSIECIDYHIRKKNEIQGIQALKGDLKNILRIIDNELE